MPNWSNSAAASLQTGSQTLKQVRCVALDAVGTLIFATPPAAEVYATMGQRYGSHMDAATVARRFAESLRTADSAAVEPGRTNEEQEREFWRRVVSDVLPDVADADRCFAELFEHFARPTSWRCFPEVGPALSWLRTRGYRVVIASNFDARLNSVCDGLPELRDVRDRVISSLVGYRKTHPGFYAAVARTAECDPGEVLMVGDDATNDVTSARRAGLLAIHLQRETSPPPEDGSIRLLTDLKERLP